MSTPLLLSACYQTRQFPTAYGAVLWDSLDAPPSSGVNATSSVNTRAFNHSPLIFNSVSDFPTNGVAGKIYIAKDTGKHYRFFKYNIADPGWHEIDIRLSYRGSRHADWLRDFYDTASIFSND